MSRESKFEKAIETTGKIISFVAEKDSSINHSTTLFNASPLSIIGICAAKIESLLEKEEITSPLDHPELKRGLELMQQWANVLDRNEIKTKINGLLDDLQKSLSGNVVNKHGSPEEQEKRPSPQPTPRI